ncbi:phosphodiester glycosidase family protein [Clostridium sp. SHJSY1]|uniref:phosphodiester glycosidase family protein n=1 Tax=Clostridium sp. SHJSY1 TaxID=2942483 RepID=UPI002874C521|nr:phosphodiester glycosidase family protein [Clostridium sp. SHJSY1]MDS0528378.1 phosphodiester glycosidase family protein [Clostridium sp. SHJSY1]
MKIFKKMPNKEEKKKRKFNWKSALGLLVFTLLFTVGTAPFILLYGPFDNAKRTFVSSAMGSMHYQWLATIFLSQEKMDEILGTNEQIDDTTNNVVPQDSSLIEIPKKKDTTIERKEIKDENEKFKGYALIVNDPTRVKIGVSSKLGKEGETVSTIAENYQAVAAINGGYFTDEAGTEKWTSNGGIPTGFLMSEGVIKQDVDPNEKKPILAITKEGKMLIGETTTAELLAKKENDKVTEAMSYVTTLVNGGSPSTIPKDKAGESCPRTLIGQRLDGAIVMVVLDSALPGDRICATLKEAQKVMLDLSCYNAVNLDGGKSTTMYYNEEVINNPSYAYGERPIASGFIVK